MQFDLNRNEAEIYVYLGNKSSLDLNELLRGLKIGRKQLFRSLKSLEDKGLIISKTKESKEFCAVPFEKVLEELVQIKMKESIEASVTKKKLLSYWRSVTWKNNSPH